MANISCILWTQRRLPRHPLPKKKIFFIHVPLDFMFWIVVSLSIFGIHSNVSSTWQKSRDAGILYLGVRLFLSFRAGTPSRQHACFITQLYIFLLNEESCRSSTRIDRLESKVLILIRLESLIWELKSERTKKRGGGGFFHREYFYLRNSTLEIFFLIIYLKKKRKGKTIVRQIVKVLSSFLPWGYLAYIWFTVKPSACMSFGCFCH